MKRSQKVAAKGIARVKKFDADQDESVDSPKETIEREFELTPNQLEEVKKGGVIEIVNGETKIRSNYATDK